QVQLLPSTASALKLLRQHGFLLIVITNQSAVARGMLTEKTLNQIHDHLKSLLGLEGAYIDKIYYCPYHPEAVVDQYRRDSDLRKPKPGMLHLAQKELDIDLDHSWIIGDDDRDIETGYAVGCRTIMLESRGSSLVRKGQSSPDFTAVNLQEAANLIIHNSRRPEEHPTEQTTPQIEDQPEKPTEEKSPETIEQTNIPEALPPEDNDTTNHQLTTEQDKTKASGQTDTETFLAHILRELKAINRDRNAPAEFSIGKLMAGVVQMLVIFCLVLAFWFATSPEPKTATTQNCLLLALTFQTLTITLLLIHRH
ncbi:MAG: HAD-IIIA family hydrolase, partial [Sedimentisphaerales bacterium]|nr:HAD-IIIA family hydrolase [Sedimentisphaerales bacterium]